MSSLSQFATRHLVCSRTLVSNLVGSFSFEIWRRTGRASAYDRRLWQLTHELLVVPVPRCDDPKLNHCSPRPSRNCGGLGSIPGLRRVLAAGRRCRVHEGEKPVHDREMTEASAGHREISRRLKPRSESGNEIRYKISERFNSGPLRPLEHRVRRRTGLSRQGQRERAVFRRPERRTRLLARHDPVATFPGILPRGCQDDHREEQGARDSPSSQVMLMGVGDGTKPNIHGEKPWIDNNPLTPNEGYFKKSTPSSRSPARTTSTSP